MDVPDFKQLAYNVTIRTDMTQRTQDRIELALRDAFYQGYQHGLDKGWGIEQDKAYADKKDD